MMRRRSIFLSKPDSLFPVKEVFIDLSNYYTTQIAFLSDESIAFYANAVINDEYYKKDIKDRLALTGDEELFKVEFLNYERNKEERFLELSKIYPNYFRCFFITQIYGFIESELKLLCFEYATNHGVALDHKQLFNFSQIQERLEKHCPEIKNKISDELRFIDKVRLVRNDIVHSSGIIDANRKEKLEKILEYDQGLFLFEDIGDDEFQISITNDKLIHELLNTGERLFIKILEQGMGLFG